MNDDASRYRLRLLGVVSMSLFVALTARLWFLQVLNPEVAEQRATANVLRTVREPGPRGRIFDVNGNIIVDNKVVNVVRVDRVVFDKAFPKRTKAAERRATITKLAIEISRSGRLTKVTDIERAIENAGPLEKVTLAADVDRELLLYIGERPEEFPGVTISSGLVRDYPYGDLAAHVLGYVGRISGPEYAARKDSAKPYGPDDDIGKTGVEKIFEEDLRGSPGTSVFEVDNNERVVREVTENRVAPKPGNDLWLTIDINLQKLTEKELADALVNARLQVKRDPTDPDITAPAGAAVVIDPQTGAVRAMASYPTYSPQDFVGGISQTRYQTLTNPLNYSPLTNRATEGQYAPGSTFKLFTAYAAVDGRFMTGQGRLPTIETRLYDDGYFDLSKFDKCTGQCEFTNSKDARGRPTTNSDVDLRKAITVSSDTYFYRIGAEIGLSKNDRAIQTVAELFGLGRVTGVQLPGEASGLIPDRELKKARHKQNPTAFPFGVWTTGDDLNLAVGQGDVLATPLQLANAYATLANGGRLFAPNIVSQVKALDGVVVRTFEPRELARIELNETARQPIVDGLLGVTSYRDTVTGADGTAFEAFRDAGVDLNQFPVAGKTGTAEVDDKADSALFVAYGPAPDPTKPNTAGVQARFAMAVVLEQSGFGGQNAAPVAANIFARALTNTVERAYSERVLAACAARTAQQLADAAARGGASKASGSSGPVAGARVAATTTAPSAATATIRVPLLRDGESCP